MLGLFSGELIFGWACYWREFCVSKRVGLDNKTARTNSLWAYIREGLLSEGFLRLRYGGLIFGRAYFSWGGGGAYYRNFTVFHNKNCVSDILGNREHPNLLGNREHKENLLEQGNTDPPGRLSHIILQAESDRMNMARVTLFFA